MTDRPLIMSAAMVRACLAEIARPGEGKICLSAALVKAKELADAVEECERMDGLFGVPTGGIAGGNELLAALAAFRAAGG